MHISDQNAFLPPTAAALKKRKRDVFGGGTWNQENSLQENIPAYQLGFQNINMLTSPPRFNIEPAPITPTSTSWLHIQQTQNSLPEMQKKRRILQPHSHNQYYSQQQLRPHSGSPTSQTAARKPPPPTLMIPFFDHRREADFSTSIPTPDDYEAVSPRTMTVSPSREVTSSLALPAPVLRPCHVCHRKPSTKVMLDAYADCELCGQRACYICLRECNSLNCRSESKTSTTTTPGEFEDDIMQCVDICREDGYLHTRPHSRNPSPRQRKVCSCCAVEGLTDAGEEIVWCLDCVKREEMNH